MSLQGSSLADAQTLLKQQSASTLLSIEYDVNVSTKKKFVMNNETSGSKYSTKAPL